MGFLSSQPRVLAVEEAAMTGQAAILEFYRAGSVMADAGRHAALFDALPDDVASIANALSGLLLHQHIAPAYGETLSPERIGEAQLRPAGAILERVLAHDGSALTTARPAARRAIGVCRHFTLLLVAILRHKGHAARSRCGFGAYFEKGRYVDHWVGEYWNAGEKRWVLVDAQLDEVQRRAFKVEFDPRDVTRDRFIIAGDAW